MTAGASAADASKAAPRSRFAAWYAQHVAVTLEACVSTSGPGDREDRLFDSYLGQSHAARLCRTSRGTHLGASVSPALGADKEELSGKLGAHHFIDNGTEDVAAALNLLGGARAVLATVTSAEATCAIDRFAARGRLVVIGVDPNPIQVSPLQLISASRGVVGVVGHAAGASIDSQDTLAFSTLSGVSPMIETMPLARAAEAYARIMRGDARFRMALTMT